MQSTPSGNLVLRRQRRQRQQQQQQQCPEPPADEEQEAATSAAKPFFNWTKSNPDGRLKLHMDPFSSFRHFHQHEPEHQNYDHAPPSLLLNPIPNHFHNSQYHSESLPHTRHGLTFSETSLLPSLLGNAVYNYPFDQSGLDFMSDSFGFLGSLPESQAMSSSPVLVGFTGVNSQPRLIDSDLSFVSQNSGTQYLPWVDDDGDSAALPLYLDGNGGNPPFLNRPKTLGRPPPEICSSPAGSDSISHPNLFQKRLALHVDSGENKGGNIRKPIQENFHMPVGFNLDKGKELAHEEQPFVNNKNNKTVEGDVDDEIKISGLESHSDEDYFPGENANHVFEMEMEMEIYNANSSVLTGDDKEKKGGRLPAKNLMAERRRRKKLNDRLYMLRSVVPKISKMDRASILADAIEYLKELLQRIKNINDELQALTAATPLQSSSSIVPQTSPIPAALPHPVKGEACKNSLPNPVNQPPTVHVEVREENAFNIHMFCSRRPGLMLSSLTALDNLGLDIHQAVISCFNGFALDVFRAEKCNAAMELHQDQIKAILLDAAAFHGLM